MRIYLPFIFVLSSIFLFFCPATVFSQILNVEKSRLEEDTAKNFIGKAAISLNLNNRGAIEERSITFLGITASSDVAYLSEKHAYMLMNFFNYISNNGDAFISSGYSHFRINFLKDQRLSYETFVQYQYDKPRGMNFRRLVGAGIRYEIVKRERVSLYAGTGIFYEEESWQSSLEEVGTRNTKLLKSNNYLSARYEARENLSFNAIVYYQAGPDRNAGLFRQRGSAEVNVTVQISNNISMKTSFSSTYENHPVIPVKKFIYALTNGIEVNF